METLAIIPARGGSKRLPGKNIKPFMGRPLIAWTIDAALRAPSVDRVVVSTDDEGIQTVARKWVEEPYLYKTEPHPKAHRDIAPFLRPTHLATDDATSEDVVIHALDWLRDEEGYEPDVVVLLQATSPLRTAVDVEMAIWLWENEHQQEYPLASYLEHSGTTLNGACYVYTRAQMEAMMANPVISYRPHFMPPERSIDIDTAEEFALAEWIARETWRGGRP